ncbi:MAG TPA: hypothetical protein DD979_01365, partial [Gammaproteobacteria bacterium]|nr:hypothetical protein [Gammaproteobacteria bacterium]
ALHSTQRLLGTDIEDPLARQRLANWQHAHREFGPFPIDVYRSESGDSFLAIDYRLTLATIKNSAIRDRQTLLACCGVPATITHVGNQELWSYGPHWSAVIVGPAVTEIWVNAKPESPQNNRYSSSKQ